MATLPNNGVEVADLSDDELDSFLTPGATTAGHDGAERRRSKRMPYSCTALVAASRGHSMPDESAFWEVRCHDLSQGGVSFYSFRRPPHEWLVICLPSNGSSNLVMSARVAYCRAVPGQGGTAYLVGCEFLERLT